ncbi:DUF4124 domain-containing protein [Rhodanobacter umsongensis]
MKATPTIKLCIAILLLAVAQAAMAQNIYKCTQGGQLEYTDRPCPGGKGELIHQADDSEVIDHYLNLGQVDIARRYADAHHLDALYKDRLAAYQQKMDDKAQQQADAAADAQQHAEDARQQAIADQSANTNRLLQAQNDALRQQNAEYADQLSQPTYYAAPAYWGAVAPPYRGHDHDHDHDHKPPGPPPKPVFHPCTSLAGGRVQC